jgi:hypothetical protein
MSVIAGLTAAKATLELTTKVMDLLNRPNVDVHAVRGHLQEMLIHVVNAQVALGEAHVEISDLRHQLEDREDRKAIEADLQIEPDGQFYFRPSERASGKDIPYCPICWGDKNRLVPLVPFGEGQAFQCGIHKTRYHKKVYLDAIKAANQRPRTAVRSSWL